MGSEGASDVAREAADIVLLDDNFASIVEAIKEGRTLFGNLKKTIAYTLTHLTPEILSTLLPLLFSTPQALASLTSLTIDLVTEQGPAIALAYEGPERDIMRVPPRNMKTERLVTVRSLTYAYLTMGLFQFAVCFMTFLWVYGDVRLPPLQLPKCSHIYSGGCSRMRPACNRVCAQVGIPLSQLLYSTDPFTTYLTCATTLANGTMQGGELLPGAAPLHRSAYLGSADGTFIGQGRIYLGADDPCPLSLDAEHPTLLGLVRDVLVRAAGATMSINASGVSVSPPDAVNASGALVYYAS